MLRKIAILRSMFFLWLGVYSCKSPEAPKEPEPNYEYRYNVEVIYSPTTSQSRATITYVLYDPGKDGSDKGEIGGMEMNKIGKDRFRCYLDKVFIQTPRWHSKHHVFVMGPGIECWTGENINIQGMYDVEIRQGLVCGTSLHFMMSKE